MCIAIIKGSGVKLPSDDTLDACWEGNKDGAGYSYVRDGKVLIKKGFMVKEPFFEALKRDVTDDTTAFIHMRIATHGGINQECTHPFPLTDNYDEMRRLETETDIAIVHNGVFSSVSGLPDKVSDTMFYIKDVLMNHMNWLDKDTPMPWLFRISLGGCRLAWMSATHCLYAGDWTKVEGCFFSNTQYRRRYPAWPDSFQSAPTEWNSRRETQSPISWGEISALLSPDCGLTGGSLRRRLAILVRDGVLNKHRQISLGAYGKSGTIGRNIRKQLSSLLCETCANTDCELSPTCNTTSPAVAGATLKLCLSNSLRASYTSRDCNNCKYYAIKGTEEPCKTCSKSKYASEWKSTLTPTTEGIPQ